MAHNNVSCLVNLKRNYGGYEMKRLLPILLAVALFATRRCFLLPRKKKAKAAKAAKTESKS